MLDNYLKTFSLVAALVLCGPAPGAGLPGAPAPAETDADPVATHFERGQAYLAKGEYARAVLEFEQVLRFDNLPPDLHQQAEIYADAARGYAAGNPLSGFGYAETGGGYYRENVTRSTRAAGNDPARDAFWKIRAGGGLSYIASDDLSLDGTLDYRFRYYDDSGRRDDSDLRWNAMVNQSLPKGSQAIGVRGRASYRGHPGYRQDYGVFVNRSFDFDEDHRIRIEAELRTRQYPTDLRERSRDIGELWLSWTRAYLDGRASLTLTANAGQEWATHDRPDGDNTFYGIEFDWGMDLSDRVGVFLFGLWQHDAYDDDRFILDEDEIPVGSFTRSDDIYELGGGLTYGFAPGWSLRPEVLYLRDESNSLWGNYSSTEVWVMVRKAF
ncbi:hypothetical protein [uncultured Thiocystis sp.]|uniref:hypothetical protein n=1 Tax=uncultured Thiocystis sp. TaxID=1202134 RepID=UPI0025D48EE3|nr:hypothetical protein [uncultured Thiocystis sp.]